MVVRLVIGKVSNRLDALFTSKTNHSRMVKAYYLKEFNLLFLLPEKPCPFLILELDSFKLSSQTRCVEFQLESCPSFNFKVE